MLNVINRGNLNAVIQVAKRKARGYGKRHFAVIAYLLTGKLDMYKVNPCVPLILDKNLFLGI